VGTCQIDKCLPTQRWGHAAGTKVIAVTDLDVITLEYSGLCPCGATFSAGEPVGFDRGRNAILCPSCLNASVEETTIGADVASLEALTVEARTAQAVQTAQLASHAARSATATRAALPSTQPSLAAAAGAGATAVPLTPPPAPASSPDAEGYTHRHAAQTASHRTLHLLARDGEPTERDLAKDAKRQAQADEALADALASVTDSGSGLLLESRRVPGSRSTIERLVVAGGGVFVIDARRYAGAPIAVRQAGGPFGPKRTDLYVRGQLRNDLVRCVQKQAGAVRTVLEGMGLGGVTVSPVLCLVGGSFPMFQATLPADETTVVGLKTLRKLLGKAGGLDAEARDRVYVSLAASLPAMT